MAPRLALMPQAMFMPSKAGPAAVDVAVSCPFAASIISPLVPMSTNSVTPRCSASFVARMPDVMVVVMVVVPMSTAAPNNAAVASPGSVASNAPPAVTVVRAADASNVLVIHMGS